MTVKDFSLGLRNAKPIKIKTFRFQARIKNNYIFYPFPFLLLNQG
ncbi:hypothetical protein SAMN04488057_11066 [Cyclobacterium lianum]|uniref:Uncharacterized protein n=1 Tax=Cyclobacterium lianum TaxID=388280 RepID=A0A1M7PS19_9BACT|nr:hypothetical protein SAMN04488057_11066 [Cyclobacterium lianum]